MKAEYDHFFRVGIVGKPSSGRQSLRSIYGIDRSRREPSIIPVEFVSKDIEIAGIKIRQHLGIPPTHPYPKYKWAQYFLLCWDLSNPTEQRDVAYYLRDIRAHGNENAEVFLVGTKSDLQRAPTNSQEAILRFAQEHHIVYLGDTSARTGDNVAAVFHAAADATLQYRINKSRAKGAAYGPPLADEYSRRHHAEPILLRPAKDVMLRHMTVHCLGEPGPLLQLYHAIEQLDKEHVRRLTQVNGENFALHYTLDDRNIDAGNAIIVVVESRNREYISRLLGTITPLKHLLDSGNLNIIFLVNGPVQGMLNLLHSSAFMHIFRVDDTFADADALTSVLTGLRDSQIKYGKHTTAAAQSLWERFTGPSTDKPVRQPQQALEPLSQNDYQQIIRCFCNLQPYEPSSLVRSTYGAGAYGTSTLFAAAAASAPPARRAQPRPAKREERAPASSCVMSLVLRSDPVIASDTYTYERTAIERWLSTHPTSPMTKQAMTTQTLILNRALKDAIEQWKKQAVMPESDATAVRPRI